MLFTLYKPGADGKIRYYSIHDRQPMLYSRYALTVSWFAGNESAREKVYSFETRADMDAKLRTLFRTKLRDGYRMLYQFKRNDAEPVPASVEQLTAESGY